MTDQTASDHRFVLEMKKAPVRGPWLISVSDVLGLAREAQYPRFGF
jgi:hypothetical protein